MSKFINNLPKIALYILMAVAIVVGLAFFVGKQTTVDLMSGSYEGVPVMTDTLLYLSYAFFGLSVLITLIVSVVTFIERFKYAPKKAIQSLIVVIVLVAVFFLAWFLGDGATVLNIPGYEGTDNVGFWSQYTDMCLFLMYFFFCATVVAMAGSYLYKTIKK